MSDEKVMLEYATPKPRRPFWHFRLPEILVIVSIIAVLIAIFLPTQSGHPTRPSVRCMANLRMMHTALMFYAQANGNVYPPRLVDTVNYGITPDMFHCKANTAGTIAAKGPTTQQTIANILSSPANVSYVYVAANQTVKALRRGGVLVYEPPGNHPRDFKGAGGCVVLFADGHASFVPAPVVTQMIKELSAGQNPPPATKGY